jgi:hypothetical protein
MVKKRRIVAALGLTLVACSSAAEAAVVTVFKNPACGCCEAWVEHLKAKGLRVEVRELQDVTPVARRLGVPDELRSCHTAQIGGQFVEGHVPAADIRRMVKQHPQAQGLAVPGMPAGSPGMEQGGKGEPFSTMIVSREGAVRVFAEHPAKGAESHGS